MIRLLTKRYTQQEKTTLWGALCEAHSFVKKDRNCKSEYLNINCKTCPSKKVCRDLQSSIDHIK